MKVYLPLLKGKRVALLVNQTSLVGHINLVDTLVRLHIHIVKIFSPEHGFRGMADAGETVGNSIDRRTGIPVISLYGTHTRPSRADLKDVDVMIYDIQDVGTRFYTYISSLQRFMEAAALNHKLLIILDRPDPNGFYVDGPVLDTFYRSFVGLQPIPSVYGMTAGEYAEMLNGEHWLSDGLHCNLKVIRCLNYTHRSIYQLPVRPSPNLPDMGAVYLYPSLCLFEGTTVSVGRGTEKPFQVFGNPDFPHQLFHFVPQRMPGAIHPPFLHDTCYGFDLSGNAERIRKNLHGILQLKWLITAYRLCPDKARFFTGYFNKLAGNDELKAEIQAGWSPEKIRESWQPGLAKFSRIRAKYLLYPL
ncbi:MAG TPA: DUF1343 domain-containing protein [Chitinophagaceae bacterium]|nr:DUF1343 domain-containing protein [Chitinophagaceae bacterium]